MKFDLFQLFHGVQHILNHSRVSANHRIIGKCPRGNAFAIVLIAELVLSSQRVRQFWRPLGTTARRISTRGEKRRAQMLQPLDRLAISTLFQLPR